MKYFKDTLGEIYGYDETQQDLVDAAIALGWEDITDSWPPEQEPISEPTPPTKEQLLAELKILTAKIEALGND